MLESIKNFTLFKNKKQFKNYKSLEIDSDSDYCDKNIVFKINQKFKGIKVNLYLNYSNEYVREPILNLYFNNKDSLGYLSCFKGNSRTFHFKSWLTKALLNEVYFPSFYKILSNEHKLQEQFNSIEYNKKRHLIGLKFYSNHDIYLIRINKFKSVNNPEYLDIFDKLNQLIINKKISKNKAIVEELIAKKN